MGLAVVADSASCVLSAPSGEAIMADQIPRVLVVQSSIVSGGGSVGPSVQTPYLSEIVVRQDRCQADFVFANATASCSYS